MTASLINRACNEASFQKGDQSGHLRHSHQKASDRMVEPPSEDALDATPRSLLSPIQSKKPTSRQHIDDALVRASHEQTLIRIQRQLEEVSFYFT
ncbi:unnamed protein product [Protopolystoma xenopodis]|uniref:Uncharacterized protein n=1 Tax=Protopolystoma xenopodis TaxID=117903 RepID=A0A448X4D0_9PLAT|nr:unnamed protein product [Protopolystoma xenopodis]